MSDFLDLENQPEEMALIPPYASAALERWTGLHRKRLRAMQALDEGIARMMQSLESSGKLENTLILFTSDHGFSTGQLRHFGKRFPYNRVTRVPFIASGAGVGKGIQCDQLLANIDIAPTLVDMAGGTIPESVDGISFAKLLHAPDSQLDRPAILIENWDRIWSNGVHIDAAFCSWRSPQHIYTEWASGSHEYYDVAADPEQVHNLYPTATESQRQEWSQNLTAERSKNCQLPPVIAREFIYPTTYEERKILSANFQPVEFSGLVESDNGLKHMALELYCDKIKSYWNGQRWTDQYATTPATLAMPGGHISRWTSSLDTTAIAFDKNERMNRRDVVVHVIATDRKDQQTRWENAFEFKMKINDPQTWIDKPAPWLDKQKPLTISGRAADNFQLDHIQLLVVDLDRNLFWDNEKKQWVKDRVDFNVDLNFDEPSDQPGHWGTWTYEFDGPQEGKIFFCPRAFDADGNFDSSVPFQIVPLEPK